jgi:hypothetical protein
LETFSALQFKTSVTAIINSFTIYFACCVY